jgi:hypothetical protein
LPHHPQVLDSRWQVVIERDIGNPLDVIAGSSGAQISLPVVRRLVAPTMPREMIHLDKEAIVRES